MKKIIALFLSILYLIPAIGVSLDIHKCGKDIKVISVNAPHANKCPCGADMPSDCCRDIQVKVKIDDNHKVSKNGTDFRLFLLKQFAITNEITIENQNSFVRTFDFSCIHAPPFKIKIPVYLKNNIFRI